MEIDLDRIRNMDSLTKFSDVSIVSPVRKVNSSAVMPSSSGSLTIPTTPSSAVEVARTVTQTMLDQADRTKADVQCQIEQNTGNVNLFYRPKK